MVISSIRHTFKRYRTLQSHTVRVLPIVILMPHSACNCRCVMCDIWKGNHNLQQLTELDITLLLQSFKKLEVQQVVMSGGEALLNPNFFRFCEILKKIPIKITLLSTGIALKKHAGSLLKWVNDIIVSLDGNEATHDMIRNIPGAFGKLREGITHIRAIDPSYKISGRTVVHQQNFRCWAAIIESAISLGLNQISFLPADVSSKAFNREQPWDTPKQEQLLISREDLPELEAIIDQLTNKYQALFRSGFIAESPEKLQKISQYYAAFYGTNRYPYKKCNAPWVSTVIEADGTVRPCFFHEPFGNIRHQSLEDILNDKNAISFRKALNTATNSTCEKCVCYINLSPRTNLDN